MNYALQKLALIASDMRREGHSSRVGLTEPPVAQSHQDCDTSDLAPVSSGLASPLEDGVDSRIPRSMTGHLIQVTDYCCSQICNRRMLIAIFSPLLSCTTCACSQSQRGTTLQGISTYSEFARNCTPRTQS